MRRSTLFLLGCGLVGATALIAMLPPRAPAPEPTAAPTSVAAPKPAAVTVLATDPVSGPANAPLTIVEFGDFTCPACADAVAMINELREEFGARLRIVWKDFPLLDRLSGSRRLHIAARCAQRGGKFWEYHHALFVEQPRDDAALAALARRFELDTQRFAACLNETAAAALVEAGAAEAAQLQLRSAPTFYANGVRLEGHPTIEDLRSALRGASQLAP